MREWYVYLINDGIIVDKTSVDAVTEVEALEVANEIFQENTTGGKIAGEYLLEAESVN